MSLADPRLHDSKAAAKGKKEEEIDAAADQVPNPVLNS